ncbi:hypothetical protein [Streptomyces sp. GC420]|uniref:hypothetical protein n=1 Tax=Streptomyces sp. GC420 TaxID=2697568 RepID=UPI001414E4F2|nr:hypothetical protein [Streptomyces sp. GC420]NBM14694.1 hypothetical protein [Streptomyces sp. GC420]
MCVDIRAVLRKQEEELRRFRRGLFSTDPADSGLASVVPATVLERLRAEGQTVPHRFGPVRSVTDRHAVLTIVGDFMDQAVLLERPGREGSVLTLSVAAKHKQLGTRQAVDPAEARAWVEAIVGPNWLPHVYSAGNLSGLTVGGISTSRPLTTAYFYLFLGTDGVPHAEPEHQLGVTLHPLADAV